MMERFFCIFVLFLKMRKHAKDDSTAAAAVWLKWVFNTTTASQSVSQPASQTNSKKQAIEPGKHSYLRQSFVMFAKLKGYTHL